MKKAIFNWSGGKDSALCLYHSLKDAEIDIRYLVTTVTESIERVSMHGVRVELLRMQAESIGIQLKEISLPDFTPLDVYDKIMKTNLAAFKNEGIGYSVFGDINLEDLRKYREERLEQISMKALFPLWNKPTKELLIEFLDLGFKTVIVCVNEKYLDKSFAGRFIDENFIKDLPANVDPCGENGEFHTFVFDGPIFRKPVLFELGELVFKDLSVDNKESVHDSKFWYRDILPVV